MKTKPTSGVWLLAGLFFLGFGMRLIHLDLRSVSMDESYTLALIHDGFSTIIQSTVTDIHPPLFYLIQLGWAKLWGTGLWPARLLTTFFSSLLIPVIFYFTRDCLNRRSAWWAAGLVTFSPYFMELGRWARMPSLTALLAALSLYFFWRAFRKPQSIGFTVAYAIFSLAAVYAHYFGFLPLLCQYAFLFLLYQRKDRDWLKGPFLKNWLMAQVTLFVGFLPWFSVFLQHMMRKITPYGNPLAFKIWDPLRLFYYFMVGSYNWGAWGKLLTAASLILAGGLAWKYAWSRPRFLSTFLEKPAGLFLGIILLLPVAIATGYSLIGTNVVDRRYLAFAAIPLLMLLGSLLARQPFRARTVMAGLLVMAFLPSLQNQWFHYGPMDNWRQVSALIQANKTSRDVLMIHPNFYKLPLQFYLTGAIPMISLPDEFNAMNLNMDDPPPLTQRDLAKYQNVIQRCPRVWLVVGNYNPKDSLLVKQWLTQTYGTPREYAFSCARAYLFVKPGPAKLSGG